MSRIVDFFRGTLLLQISGAWPEGCLNRFSEQKIAFWDTRSEDEFTYKVRIYSRDAERADKAAQRAMCDCRVVKVCGFRRQFGQLRYRVLLILCAAALLAALCILPQFVWTIEVEGCETLHEQQVIRALESIGIGFGTWGPSIDSQNVKNHMLVLLPELEWIAVNRSGGRATVLVQERTQTPEVTDRRAAGNIVASRTGIITQMLVLAGEPVVEPGQTVLRGELLVSGYFDRTTGVQITHAMAEIYARTWRQETAVTPARQAVKTYTGEEKTRFALVLGTNRINFYRNSGISDGNCDKMTQASTLTLPGGFTLPITLIEETYLEYTLTWQDVDAASAEERLEETARAYVASSLVGGEIVLLDTELRVEEELLLLDCVAECTEQIALEVPTDPE